MPHRPGPAPPLSSTTFDFGDGSGPVPAKRHVNPDGFLGGWVADTAFVAHTAYVEACAKVYGLAQVFDKARITQDAQVYGTAQVSGAAKVYGEAHVYDAAHVYGDAVVRGNARVFGRARVWGEAQVFGQAQVCGSAQVTGIAWSEVFIEKTEDLKHGVGWTAYRLSNSTDIGFRRHDDRNDIWRFTLIPSWDDLDQKLWEEGFLSDAEYFVRRAFSGNTSNKNQFGDLDDPRR